MPRHLFPLLVRRGFQHVQQERVHGVGHHHEAQRPAPPHQAADCGVPFLALVVLRAAIPQEHLDGMIEVLHGVHQAKPAVHERQDGVRPFLFEHGEILLIAGRVLAALLKPDLVPVQDPAARQGQHLLADLHALHLAQGAEHGIQVRIPKALPPALGRQHVEMLIPLLVQLDGLAAVIAIQHRLGRARRRILLFVAQVHRQLGQAQGVGELAILRREQHRKGLRLLAPERRHVAQHQPFAPDLPHIAGHVRLELRVLIQVLRQPGRLAGRSHEPDTVVVKRRLELDHLGHKPVLHRPEPRPLEGVLHRGRTLALEHVLRPQFLGARGNVHVQRHQGCLGVGERRRAAKGFFRHGGHSELARAKALLSVKFQV